MSIKKGSIAIGVISALILLAVVGATDRALKTSAKRIHSEMAGRSHSQIKRGEYLVNAVGGCSDCHTPHIMTSQGPVPDPARLLAGSPQDEKVPDVPDGTLGPDKWGGVVSVDMTTWAGPWGVSFSSNLTPDSATGIGSWSEKMFIASIRKGKYWGSGRDLLPPMPWQTFRNLTDNDLGAIYAYLMSIKPVANVVPAPVLPRH